MGFEFGLKNVKLGFGRVTALTMESDRNLHYREEIVLTRRMGGSSTWSLSPSLPKKKKKK
ncbi:hypothetical protein Csa_008690 [Cucumis sativus]|uniref:Uncharacterized protein n=1 Tax=Cucumis sativus TaxID=3659 RepID=A0A0A0KPF3_CUCSA|nr:hypothetical protein Csa_008690 [Cucumis sativus]